MREVTVQGAPAGVRADRISSAVKPSLFFVGKDEKYDCIDDEAGIVSLNVGVTSDDVSC